MRKLFLMGTLLVIASMSQAQNQLVVDDIELPQDGQAALTVQYQFTEADKYAGCQFEVVLPEGLSFVTNAQGNALYTPGDCFEGVPNVGGNLVNGIESFSCFGSYDVYIKGTTGTLVTFSAKMNSTLPVGQKLTGMIRNIVIGSRNEVSSYLDDVIFTITIGEPIDPHIILDENSLVIPDEADNVDVRILRTINAGEWSTICLPFSATGEQVKQAWGEDVQLASFTGWESEEDTDGAIVAINVNFTSANADDGIAANTPMLIQVSEATETATFDGVTIEPEEKPVVQVGKKASERGYFYGTYTKTIVPEENIFLSENNFWYSTGSTAIKGYRGYFEFRDVLDAYYDGSEVQMNFFIDDDATGIQALSDSPIKGEDIYNLAGQRVGKNYKGVVVTKGKKIVK